MQTEGDVVSIKLIRKAVKIGAIGIDGAVPDDGLRGRVEAELDLSALVKEHCQVEEANEEQDDEGERYGKLDHGCAFLLFAHQSLTFTSTGIGSVRIMRRKKTSA